LADSTPLAASWSDRGIALRWPRGGGSRMIGAFEEANTHAECPA